jgi:hypothetical protein
MWIYQHVDGEVHEYFQSALEAVRELQRAWAEDKRGERLGELVAPWVALVERCRGRLERYDNASPEAQTLARVAYIATLDLVDFLDSGRNCELLPPGPRVDATFAVLDMLEEWQPYISFDDQALNLIVLDDLSPSEALAAVKTDHGSGTASDDYDCPLCRLFENDRVSG